MPHFTVIVKPVGTRCNIACKYCYNKNTVQSDSKKKRMSDEVLETMSESFLTLSQGKTQFIWHGGEPLLAGKEFFRKAIVIQRNLCDITPKNLVQTNGVLLEEKWIKFLSDLSIGVGLSLDGPASLHDINRIDHKGKGTFQRVMKTVSLLQENKISFGLGAVITDASLNKPEELYSFFRNNDLHSFDFSPCAEINRETGILEKYSVTPEGYAEFMVRIFDLWFEEDNPLVRNRFFKSIIRSVLGKSPTLCIFKKNCADILAVDYNGDVTICGRFMGIEEMKIGNLMEQPLKVLISSKKYLTLKEAMNTKRDECRVCPVEYICQGGCPYHSFLINGALDSPNYFCETFKRVIPHIKKRVDDYLAQT